ncbi:MAG TPA: Lrp/AsnC family transcriptional regulator [Euryarchaeota archaeon]|nr:Lrp/AsnC family transcriptional regulator [Euryarchaeota archaeon]
MSEISLNKKELEIIEKLLENPKASYKSISKKTGIPSSTVKYIVDKLEETGVIEFKVDVNVEKLGFKIADLGVAINSEDKDKVLEEATKIKGVKVVNRLAGAHDAFMIIVAEDDSGYAKVIDELRAKGILVEHFGPIVKEYKTSFPIKIIKKLKESL